MTVSVPDVKGRQELLTHYLKDKPVHTDVDVKTLARGTTGMSGAELANVVNEAALEAAKRDGHSITASLMEFAKDKVLMGAERKSMMLQEKCKRTTAYHESGHAIVAVNTPGASPVHKATIMPRGQALGMVMQLPSEDEHDVTRQQLMARLDVLMGGRVAEEIIFGKDHVTTGAKGDFSQATRLARGMVMSWGMSDEVGHMYVDSESMGSDVKRKVDGEVSRLLEDAYARVMKLLKSKEKDLHTLSRALIDRETLTGSEVLAVLAGKTLPDLPEKGAPRTAEAGADEALKAMVPSGGEEASGAKDTQGGDKKEPEPVT